MWSDIRTAASCSLAWALRDQSQSLVICSQEFNIALPTEAAVASALSLWLQIRSLEIFSRSSRCRKKLARKTQRNIKRNFGILKVHDLLKTNTFNLSV
jgi:hypothetical protein